MHKNHNVIRIRFNKIDNEFEIEKFKVVYAGFCRASMVFEGERGSPIDASGNPTNGGGLVYTFKKSTKSNLRVQISELDFGVVLDNSKYLTVWCFRGQIENFKKLIEEGDYDCGKSISKKKRSEESIKIEKWSYECKSHKKIYKRGQGHKRVSFGKNRSRNVSTRIRRVGENAKQDVRVIEWKFKRHNGRSERQRSYLEQNCKAVA